MATARLCLNHSEEDVEDVAQLLRIKVWKALCAYDPAKSRTSRDRYVFMCLRDRAKDVMKKKKRDELHIEDLRNPDRGSDRFDERYLSSSHDDNYAFIEDDDDTHPGLDELERSIVSMLLTGDFIQAELAAALGVSKADIEGAMKSIRSKLRPEPLRLVPPARSAALERVAA